MSLAPAAPAMAQDADATDGGLREIVVTARRVEERLQDVPLSVTALDAKALSDNQISQVQDLGAQVPNLITGKTSVAGSGQIAIRGVQGQSLPRTGLDTRVGVYLDGVYLARSQGNSFSLADIERIEVLKGPQGTLFGRNVTAGSINIITAAPTGEFGGTLEGGIGNRNRQHYRATLELPRMGGFSVRITYMHDQQDGDVPNGSAGYRPAPVALNVPAQAATPASATSDARPASPAYSFNYPLKRAVENFGDQNYDSIFLAARYDGIDGLTADYKFDWNDQKEAVMNQMIVGWTPGQGCVFSAIALGASLNQCTATRAPGSAFPGIPSLANGVVSNAPTITNVGGADGYFLGSGAQNFSFGNSRPSRAWGEFTGGSWVRTWGHNLTLNYEASDNLNLRSITAYRKLRTGHQVDADGGTFTLNNDALNAIRVANGLPATYTPGGATPYPAGAGIALNYQHQFSQEFQAFGSATEWLDYLVGLYYFREKGHSIQVTQLSNVGSTTSFVNSIVGRNGIPPYSPTVNNWGIGPTLGGDDFRATNESRAIFGRVTLKPVEKVDIVLGGRYTQDRKKSETPQFMVNFLDADPLNTPAYREAPPTRLRQKWSKFTYDGTITYHVTPDINIYGRYATAYLAGGALRNVAFQPETTKAAEIGFKSELFDRHVRFNAAAFWQKSRDVQFSRVQGISVVLPGQTTATTVQATTLQNLGTLRVRGFEAELTAIPVQRLTLTGSVGYSDQKYVVDPRISSITRPPAAEWTIQASVQYDTPPVMGDAYLSLRLDANYRSRYSPQVGLNLPTTGALPAELLALYGLPNSAAGVAAYSAMLNKQIEVGGFWLANARLSLADIPLAGTKARLSGFIKNIFDEDRLVYLAPYGLSNGGTFVEKRSYGLDLVVNF